MNYFEWRETPALKKMSEVEQQQTKKRERDEETEQVKEGKDNFKHLLYACCCHLRVTI